MNALIKKVIVALTVTTISIANIYSLAVAEEYTSADGCVYEYSINSRGAVINAITFGADTTELTIPDEFENVKLISFGEYMEINGNADQIKTISMGSSDLNSLSFTSFKNLETVTLPSSLKKIPDGCFQGCKNLKYVIIPDGVTSIGFSSFKDCEKLEKIIIPSSVAEINDEAFYNCKNLADIEWDRNIDIGRKVFDGTAYIKDYPEDFLLTHNDTVLYKYTGKNKTAVIPDSVKRIEEYAFSESAVEKVVYPPTLKTITMHAFSEADNLKEIEFKGKIDKIETEAFSYCNSLTEPIIPEGITEIPDSCFLACKNIQVVKIPAHIKEIGTYAFAENKSLKMLEIADGVEKIDSGAFEHCEELTKVTVPASVKEIKEYAFNGCEKLDLKLSGSTAYATNPPEITRAPKTTDTPKPTKKPMVTDTPKETIIPTAFAAELSDEVIKDLHKFQIIADVNDIRPDDNLTRAEAVKMICVAQGNDLWDNTESYKQLFSDLPINHWAAKYVEIAIGEEIVNGYSDNTFKPENNVTNQELQKMIVCALGYNIWCKAYGEYPRSYLYYSNLLKIPQGLNLDNEAYATRAEAMQMIYNALDAPLLDTRQSEVDRVDRSEKPIVKLYDGKDGNPLITLRKILSGEVEW